MRLDDVVAQDPAVRTLRRAMEDGRLASAYLFEGPSGVGKERTALALASEVVACGDAEIERRIAQGRHPDVRVFAPRDEGSRNIPVDFLRNEILPVAQYAPFEAARALLLFPEADVSFPLTHPEAANALLKTLEEPRPGVTFVLLSERPDRLLPTIRSRCQRLRFARLPDAVVERVLAEHEVPEEARAVAVALADGRADRALTLAETGTGEAVLALALRFDHAAESGGPGAVIEAAEEVARSAQLPLVLETLATFYRDVACAGLGLGDPALAFRHEAPRVRARAGSLDPARASARVAFIGELGEALEANANAQIALEALAFRLRAGRG